MKDGLLTHEELAQKLKVRPSTVKAWAKVRQIPAVRVSPKVISFDYEEAVRALREGQAQGGKDGQ